MEQKQIELVIESPRGSATMTFDKTAKVAEVIEAARARFGFEPGAFVLRRANTNEALAPERPLVSYQFKEHEVLRLVPEMGSGV